MVGHPHSDTCQEFCTHSGHNLYSSFKKTKEGGMLHVGREGMARKVVVVEKKK